MSEPQQQQQQQQQQQPQGGYNVGGLPVEDANAAVADMTAGQAQQPPNAYDAIIAQQQAQINALIAQTNAQSAQITQLVQNGGQFPAQTHQQAIRDSMTNPAAFVAPMPQPQTVQFPNVYQPIDTQAAPNANWQPPSMLDDRDYSLEALGKEIGKHDGR